jgi:urease accessory protein
MNTRRDNTLRQLVLLCLLLLWSDSASAHILEGDAVGGFISGFKHPISGLDHIVAMVSVGLWGAQLGAPAIWLLPVTFPIVMAFGGMLGLMGVPLHGIETGIALSAIGLGAMVASEARPPLVFAALLVGFFAIFHGYAHGTELPPDENGVLYSMGFVIATGLLHLTGIGIGLIHRWQAGQMILRLGGAAVAAAGGWFLAGGAADLFAGS